MKELNEKQKQRVELVRSMECCVRALNDEEILEGWLMNGVADGDIDENTTDEYIYETYCEKDGEFADIMACFARTMRYAVNDPDIDKEDREKGNDIFYLDGVVSQRSW